MQDASPAVLVTTYASDTETPLFNRAVERLGEALAALAPMLRLKLNPRPALRPAGVAEEQATTGMVILSPAAALDDPAASFEVEAFAQFWTEACNRVVHATGWPPFVCTVFRYVPGLAGDVQLADRRDRIRRLNLALVEASRATGAFVIDLDRACAALGAGLLKTDYRLEGEIALELGATVIAETLLRAAPDEVLPASAREPALAWLRAAWARRRPVADSSVATTAPLPRASRQQNVNWVPPERLPHLPTFREVWRDLRVGRRSVRQVAGSSGRWAAQRFAATLARLRRWL